MYCFCFCFFFFSYRKNVEALIKDLIAQRNAIKKHGITVDGRHFKVKFTGTDFASTQSLQVFVFDEQVTEYSNFWLS